MKLRESCPVHGWKIGCKFIPPLMMEILRMGSSTPTIGLMEDLVFVKVQDKRWPKAAGFGWSGFFGESLRCSNLHMPSDTSKGISSNCMQLDVGWEKEPKNVMVDAVLFWNHHFKPLLPVFGDAFCRNGMKNGNSLIYLVWFDFSTLKVSKKSWAQLVFWLSYWFDFFGFFQMKLSIRTEKRNWPPWKFYECTLERDHSKRTDLFSNHHFSPALVVSFRWSNSEFLSRISFLGPGSTRTKSCHWCCKDWAGGVGMKIPQTLQRETLYTKEHLYDSSRHKYAEQV